PNTPAFGGAILSSSSGFFFDSPTTLTVDNCSFTNNRAIAGNADDPFFSPQAAGGAVFVGGGSIATVNHSIFQGNIARGGDNAFFFAGAFGGALENGGATLIVRSSTFTDNTARGGTGANSGPGTAGGQGWDGIGGGICATSTGENPTTDVAD